MVLLHCGLTDLQPSPDGVITIEMSERQVKTFQFRGYAHRLEIVAPRVEELAHQTHATRELRLEKKGKKKRKTHMEGRHGDGV